MTTENLGTSPPPWPEIDNPPVTPLGSTMRVMRRYYSKESLGVSPGDRIIWLGTLREGLESGTKGTVREINDGCAPQMHESIDTEVLPWALVEWDNGQTSGVELEEKWELVAD